MSHQAIARKWRPRVFEEIAGQGHVTRTLGNAIKLGRIHHAFLLTGARGVGKTSAARILARALNCKEGPAPNPCNECSNCTAMLAGTFPDLIEIDAASHNSVDDIRDLVEKVRYTPQIGRYKVYIIDEVHMVTKQGFNALLKTLEEPPPHVIFVLATTDPQQLLDTVISRCQRFDFKMIPVRTTFDYLKRIAEAEGLGIPDSSLMVIAREGGGSMRDAQSLLDQILSFTSGSVTEEEVASILGFIDRSILYDVLQAALEGDAGRGLEELSKVGTFGYDVRSFANQLLEAVRNVTIVRQVSDGGRLLDLPDDDVSRLERLAQGREPIRLHRQFDVLADAVDAITRSEQPMLLLEMAVAKMASIRDFVPVQGLIDRLEALERRLRKAGSVPPRRSAPSEAPPPRRSAPPPRRVAPPPPAPEPPRAPAPPPPRAPAPKPEPPRSAEPDAPPPPVWDDEPVASPPVKVEPAAPPVKVEPAAPPVRFEPPGLPVKAEPAAPPAKVEPLGDSGDVLNKLLNFHKTGGNGSGGPPRPAPAPSAPAPPAAPPVEAAPPAPPVAEEPAPPPVEAAPPPPVAEEPAPPPVEAAPPPPRRAAPRPAPAPPTSTPARRRPPAEPQLPPDRPDPEGSELCDGTRWRRFVFGLRGRNDLGASVAALARAGFLGASDGTIHLGFGSEIAVRQMESLAATPGLMDALQGVFGGDAKLSWSLDDDSRRGRSLVEELELRKAALAAKLDADSRADGAVQMALEMFEGSEIAGVRLPDNLEVDDVR